MTDDEGHRNDERTVNCPVDGCEDEVLARGINLHVRRSAGNGHGEQGEVPAGISFDDLETVGSEPVEMNYPEERDTERVARLCPYCGTSFVGKQGVLIHLGQVAGRKNHPEGAADYHRPEDFPRVRVDEEENITAVIEQEPVAGPSGSEVTIPVARVYHYIGKLLSQNRSEEAQRARRYLLQNGEVE
ncbi:hypothetical protein CK500_16035 [Halorubrum salipaludis]|uniref:Uncharacterized protein n=1 Tax=Halorubrum salipaludis TaxID=2032630 RepID=A0A2A2F4V0_9EURY|nr:hypothetical protein [Halorubrum salipaludis]PAU79744.1 hypothetical protein CK500_16035 [Halorubrum salipaludis]